MDQSREIQGGGGGVFYRQNQCQCHSDLPLPQAPSYSHTNQSRLLLVSSSYGFWSIQGEVTGLGTADTPDRVKGDTAT